MAEAGEHLNSDEATEVAAMLARIGMSERLIGEILAQPVDALPVDAVFYRHATMTASELAERTGVSLADVDHIYRLSGVPLSEHDGVRFSEEDLTLVSLFHLIGSGFMPESERDDLLRLIGSAVARISEGSISAYSHAVEGPIWDSDQTGSPHLASLRALATGIEAIEQVAVAIAALLCYNFAASTERQRLAQHRIESRLAYRSAVGFVDLVGFTAISGRLSFEDLAEVIRDFEARAFELITDVGGRVVKHVGDEVMFTAPTVEAGCSAALDLVGGFADDRVMPRGGLAFGDLLTRGGDHYGPVVNLASRLGDHAVPGEVLCDRGVAAAIPRRFTVEPAGRRILKGFDEPVPVWSLGRSAGSA